MAFEDALVLSELLAATGPTPGVLSRFEQRRAARVRWIRTQTDRRDRLRRLATPVRDMLLRLTAQRMYRANYRPLLAEP